MRFELFKGRVFIYIFLLTVGFGMMNLLMEVSKPTQYLGITLFKVLAVLITVSAFTMFFIRTNHNHAVFRIYIYFTGIIIPSYFILYLLKEFVFYGVNAYFLETHLQYAFSLVFGIILLIFYNKFKIEHPYRN